MDWLPLTWITCLALPPNWVRSTSLEHCFFSYLIWIFVVLGIWTWSCFLHGSTNPVILGERIFLTIFANWKYRFKITYCFVFTISKRTRGFSTEILFLEAAMLNYILIPTMFAEGWNSLWLGSLTFLMDGLEELGLIDWTWCCFIWLFVFEGPRHSSGHWETTTSVIKLTIVSVLTRPVDIWISLITQQLTSHLLFYASPNSRLRNDQPWDVTIMVVTF